MQLPTITMKRPAFAKFNQMSKKHKISAAGALAATAVVLTVTGLEATAGAGSVTAASTPTGYSAPTVTHGKELDARSAAAPQAAPVSQKVTHQAVQVRTQAADAAAKQKKAAAAVHHAAATKKHTAVAKKHTAAAKPATKHYANNLDGWIRESLDIMHKKGIPGTYEGIHRNVMRESSGNPKAINLWDINARNGIPSKGLLQVIDPTFNRFHVAGTSHNIYDPVANITAACNYAADRYGTMDNVNSAY
jgi:hypothetical protein